MSTAEFLDALDPRHDALFTIETYTDLPKGAAKPKPDPLSKQWPDLIHAGVLGLVPELNRLNDAGAGVFIAVNEFAGPRRKANIKRVRGIHADFDGAEVNQLKAAFNALRPSILVESSPDKFHAYWLLKDGEVMDPATTEAINKRLVQAYGADPAASDCSRLLRLSGFKHMKNRAVGSAPTVRLLKVTDLYYTVDELKAAFPPVAPTQHQPALTAPFVTLPANPATTAQLARQCEADQPFLWQGQWKQRYPSQSEADMALAGCIARHVFQADIPEAERFNTIEAVFNQSGLATREKWQSRPDYRLSTINAALTQPQSTTNPDTPALVSDHEHGDVLNGRAFARQWRDRLVYVASAGKWLKWVGD